MEERSLFPWRRVITSKNVLSERMVDGKKKRRRDDKGEKGGV